LNLNTVKIISSAKIQLFLNRFMQAKGLSVSINQRHSRQHYHVGNLAEQLLSSARTMLEEVGAAKLSMRALCNALGVTPTAAYHHFSNRAELLAQLATEGYLELAEVLNEKSATLSIAEKMRGFCLIYLGFARRNTALYQLMFGPQLALENMPEHLSSARQLAFSRLEMMVADLLQQPHDSIEVRSAALASWSYIHGLTSLLLHDVLQQPAGVSDQRIIERTLAAFEVLFRGHAASINTV